MPVLSARDRHGQVMVPGDRVAIPVSPDGPVWIGGSLLGFTPWEKEAVVLLYPPGDGATVTVPASTCWRLGSRASVPW